MKLRFVLLISLCCYICKGQVSDFKSINFTIAENTAKYNNGESLNNLPLLAYKLTKNLKTDVEKFRAIYLWVCQNITVDVGLSNKVINKRKAFKNDSLAFKNWNTTYNKTVFKKLIKHKKTMCSGFAYIIKQLCLHANIDCKIINGYARTANTNTEDLVFTNHSWNAVKLNNKWYLADATWSSGYEQNGRFIKNFNDGYFLADPILFARNHYPIEKKWLLNTDLIESKFVATPIVYSETFLHQTLTILPKKLVTEVEKNKAITFCFESLKNLEAKHIKLILLLGNREVNLEITNLNTINNKTSFKAKLKYKGFYDVHLKLDKDIVASYSFNVK